MIKGKQNSPSKKEIGKQIMIILKKALGHENRVIVDPSLREKDEFNDELDLFEDEIKEFLDNNEDYLSKEQEEVLNYVLKKLGIISG
ncbi:MAG: hypothetical protein ACI9QC_000240 [Oceanicoccus sp.]|jgi:hypothetical protein